MKATASPSNLWRSDAYNNTGVWRAAGQRPSYRNPTSEANGGTRRSTTMEMMTTAIEAMDP